MNTANENERLTRLGHVLIDLSTVNAVTPLQGGAPEDGYGFQLVTAGGSLEVRDNESIEAVREHFYKPSSSS